MPEIENINNHSLLDRKTNINDISEKDAAYLEARLLKLINKESELNRTLNLITRINREGAILQKNMINAHTRREINEASDALMGWFDEHLPEQAEQIRADREEDRINNLCCLCRLIEKIIKAVKEFFKQRR